MSSIKSVKLLFAETDQAPIRNFPEARSWKTWDEPPFLTWVQRWTTIIMIGIGLTLPFAPGFDARFGLNDRYGLLRPSPSPLC